MAWSTGVGAQADAPPRGTCDAWFGIHGRFSTEGNDMSFTLVNRSTGRPCVATRVMLLLRTPERPDAVTPAAPANWQVSPVPCSGGGHVCGIVWEGRGVVPGKSLAGFGLVTAPAVHPSAWVVELDGHWVALQVGLVGG